MLSDIKEIKQYLLQSYMGLQYLNVPENATFMAIRGSADGIGIYFTVCPHVGHVQKRFWVILTNEQLPYEMLVTKYQYLGTIESPFYSTLFHVFMEAT